MNLIDKHIKAEQLRESEKFFEALELYDEVIVAYGEEKNYKGMADVLQGKVLTYKHLYLNTKEDRYYILGRENAKAGLAIAKNHKLVEMYASCYFRMGEMEMTAGKKVEAEKYFRKAVEKQGKSDPVWGDFAYHLGTIMCELGKKEEGLKKMRQGMEHINKFEGKMDDYVFKVWKSGVLMKIAKADEKRREKYMKMAKKIVYGDERLIIRKKQFEKLEGELKV